MWLAIGFMAFGGLVVATGSWLFFQKVREYQKAKAAHKAAIITPPVAPAVAPPEPDWWDANRVAGILCALVGFILFWIGAGSSDKSEEKKLVGAAEEIQNVLKKDKEDRLQAALQTATDKLDKMPGEMVKALKDVKPNQSTQPPGTSDKVLEFLLKQQTDLGEIKGQPGQLKKLDEIEVLKTQLKEQGAEINKIKEEMKKPRIPSNPVPMVSLGILQDEVARLRRKVSIAERAVAMCYTPDAWNNLQRYNSVQVEARQKREDDLLNARKELRDLEFQIECNRRGLAVNH